MLFGVTVILAVVSPLLHKYVVPPDAVNVALSPVQIVTSSPASAETVSIFTVTVTSSVASQPFKNPVTVNVVVLLGDTEILVVVSPVLHRYESAPEAVNVVDSFSIMVTSLPPLTSGRSLTVTTTSSVSETVATH